MTTRITATIFLSTALFAQPEPPNQAGQSADQGQYNNEDERPERGVARISLLNGDVSVRRGDSGDWIAAGLNAPVVVDDRVLTGRNSRAEVQFDWANLIRLSGDSEIRMAILDPKRYTIQIARGTTEFTVLGDYDSEPEISTPSVAIRPLRRGLYRITVLEDGTTEITVRKGEAEITTGRGGQRLSPGQTMLVRGTADDPEFQTIAQIGHDEFDRFNEGRDRELESSKSAKHVSRDIYGAEELDQHGQWVDDADYGQVWSPRVSGDWAPYREGRWTWMDYYGWTWVSADPWGWAPYHYGRWFWSGPRSSWCWFPGGRQDRQYWSPALVGFFGSGRGFGVGVGFGNVGWVPLAPHERYNRWYGRGVYGGYRGGQGGNITVVNNTNITNVYRNARVNNGITNVAGDRFGQGRVQNVAVSSDQIQRASLMRGQLPMTPERSSLRVADRESRVQGSQRAGSDTQRFYSRRQVGNAEKVPFEQQRQSVSRSAERTSSRPAEFGGRVSGASPAETPARGGGWRRAGEQSGSSTPAAVQPNGNGNADRGSGNWRRMSESSGSSGSAAPAPRQSQSGATIERGSGSGRRMNEQNGGAAPTPAPTERRNSTSGGDRGWRRFGDSGSAPSQAPAPARGGESQPQAAPRQERQNRETMRPQEERRAPVNDTPIRRQFGDPGGRAERAPSAERQPSQRPVQSSPAPQMRQEAPRVQQHSSGGGESSRSNPGGSRGERGDRGQRR